MDIFFILLLCFSILVAIIAVVCLKEYYDPTPPGEVDDCETLDTPSRYGLPKGWPEVVFTFDASSNRGEHTTRATLEKIYNKPFPKDRTVIVNPTTGKALELDGYCEELSMAFEYNSYYHYRFPNDFHDTEKEFNDLVWRDDFKFEECKSKGIYLITVPGREWLPFEHIPAWVEYFTPEAVATRNRINNILDQLKQEQ